MMDFKPMDTDLKSKWVSALRSGEFKQGRRKLRDGENFCCLGVLCVVAGIPINDAGMWPTNEDNKPGYEPIWELVGGERRYLPEMNDKGKSFFDLAKYIEAHL